MANVIGPDVSFYQDDPMTPQGIDFVKMARTAGYVIIRAGQNLWVDPDFRLNWSEAKRAGLPRGSYWFYDSRAEPKRQAELWVQQFAGDLGELPLFADFEEAYNGVYKGWRNWYTFLERLKQLVGNKEIAIYTAYYYWRDNAPTANPANLEYFHQYPLWIANYGVTQPLVPRPWRSDEWLFWQFTESGDGQLYGVESGGIDLNYFHGDEAEFKDRFDIPDVPPPPPDPGTPTGKMYKVTATILNVRQGPGVNFNVIGQLSLNEVVEEIGANADRTWLRIRRADGTLSGWCFAQFLQLVSTNPPPPPDEGTPTGRKYKVTASALKVREGPGLSYTAIGLLVLDEVVEEIGATPDRTWLRVRKADGSLRGWSSADYLERVDVTPPPPPPPPPDDEGTPTGKKYRVIASVLNVRQGPGTVYNQIGQLPFNEIVEEIGANADRTWLRVRKLDLSLRGWCFAAYLETVEIIPPPPPPPLPDDENRNWYRVLATTLILRETPNPRSRALAFFSKDDSVPAIDDTTEPQWIRVRRLDGLTGWCERRSLSLRGPARPTSYRQRIFNGVYYTRKELTDPRRNVVHVLGIDLQTTGMQFLV
ncbi:MAG: SH3 domain-containing protein, partial [Chloroflexota bacterium]